MNLIVRLANERDIDIVHQFDATDDKNVFQYQSNIAFTQSLVASESAYLAFWDNVPIGYARVDYIWPEKVPLLSWLYVEEAFRKRSVAEVMRNFVFTSIRDKGYEAILRSACTKRPYMINLLKAQCQPAGQLTFLDGTVEYFFWHKL